VTVTDPVPGNVQLVSASTTKGTCTLATKGRTVTCTVGTLAGGSSAMITIVVTPTKTGTLTDTATVKATGIKTDADDSATANTTVT
jgi:hypothetical protein